MRHFFLKPTLFILPGYALGYNTISKLNFIIQFVLMEFSTGVHHQPIPISKIHITIDISILKFTLAYCVNII